MARGRIDRRRRRSSTTAPLLAERPTEADVRDELEYADAPRSVPTGRATTRSWRAARLRRPPAPPDRAAHDRRGRHRHRRRRRARRRLPLRHDPLVRRRRADARAARRLRPASARPSAAGLGDGARRRRRPRRRCGVPRGVPRPPATSDWYLHGTGHGVGLDIHEDPFASPVSTAELLEGDVVTVEPGLYRDGFGGFRIEDLVRSPRRAVAPLTHLPKDAPCLPSPPTT